MVPMKLSKLDKALVAMTVTIIVGYYLMLFLCQPELMVWHSN
jgi:hypothetical protein